MQLIATTCHEAAITPESLSFSFNFLLFRHETRVNACKREKKARLKVQMFREASLSFYLNE